MGKESKKDPTGFGGSALNLHQPHGARTRLAADSVTPVSREVLS